MSTPAADLWVRIYCLRKVVWKRQALETWWMGFWANVPLAMQASLPTIKFWKNWPRGPNLKPVCIKESFLDKIKLNWGLFQECEYGGCLTPRHLPTCASSWLVGIQLYNCSIMRLCDYASSTSIILGHLTDLNYSIAFTGKSWTSAMLIQHILLCVLLICQTPIHVKYQYVSKRKVGQKENIFIKKAALFV